MSEAALRDRAPVLRASAVTWAAPPPWDGAFLAALRARYATLTSRERQVFAGVTAGHANKAVGPEPRHAERDRPGRG